MVSLNFANWNQMAVWLRQLNDLRQPVWLALQVRLSLDDPQIQVRGVATVEGAPAGPGPGRAVADSPVESR